MNLICPAIWLQTSRFHDRVRPHVLQTGALARYADGGYPLYYLVETHRDLDVACPACATAACEWGESDTRVVDVAVNWETPNLFCTQCNKEIEMAYPAEPPRARLDAERTAKPLTRIIAHVQAGEMVGPGITVPMALETETGDRIPLKGDADV